MRRFTVQQRESTTHKGIPQASEPAGLLAGERREMPTYSFNEHQLTQPRQHTLTACPFVGGSGDGEPHKLAEPAIFETTVSVTTMMLGRAASRGLNGRTSQPRNPQISPSRFDPVLLPTTR